MSEDRRTDHATRAALLRLRMIEHRVAHLLHPLSSITAELSAAIDGVVELLRSDAPNKESV